MSPTSSQERAQAAQISAQAPHWWRWTALDQHQLSGGPARLGAGEHKPEMFRLDMPTADFQAVLGRHAEAGLVAGKTGLDAALHLG